MADAFPAPETLPAAGAPRLPGALPPLPRASGEPPTTRGSFANPVLDTGPGRDHGDPFVLRWHGRYFLYYTGAAGIEVWTGTDLAHWTRAGLALVAPAGDHWAQVDLWAPEVLYDSGWFYMYVTGTRHLPAGVTRRAGVGVDHGDDELRRQGVARARDPLGPFVLDDAPLLGVWSIDGHPFVDLDGRRWLFYNVRDDSTRYRGTVPGCGNLVDELVAPDAVHGAPTSVTLPDAGWEGNRSGSWYWNEGPTVLRRHGRYVQMYSGGWYGDASYGVGFAVADSPRGPWVKAAHNPVFVSGSRITGPGHHSVTVGPDGVTPYAIYHGYVDGELGRKVHVDRLHWSTEGPRVGTGTLPGLPTEGPQPLPDVAVHDPAVPYWHAEAWVRGRRVRLGDLVVELPAARDALLDITAREQKVRVVLDGRLVADDAAAGDPARVALHLASGGAVDGDLLSLALTSWREDPQPCRLAAGEVMAVAWGGSLPVEVSVAVAGEASVRLVEADAGVLEVTAGAEPGTGGAGLAELVRLRSDAGVERLEIRAAAGGALVSDLVLTARLPLPAAREGLDAAGEIPGQRPAVEP